MSINPDRIREMIAPFKFGKLDLLDRLPDLEILVEDELIVIPNWADYSLSNPHGDCVGLSVKAGHLLQQEYPDAVIDTCIGHDPRWFTQATWNEHAFLTVSETPDAEKLLVDPSFHKVLPLKESGYTINQVEDRGAISFKYNLGKAPLFITYDKGLCLGIDERTGIIFYLDRNDRFPRDLFLVTTIRPAPLDCPPELKRLMPFMKNEWAISQLPEEVREKIPYMKLAYLLEQKFQATRG